MQVDRLNSYNYPIEINSIINEFVSIVEDLFTADKVGILLIGSAARGELCWSKLDNQTRVFSDIEFMVALNSITRRQRKILNDAVNKLGMKYSLGSRFHLDYVVIKWSLLSRLDKRLIIFDSKNTGIDLTSHCVKDLLPEVTRSNINFNELNDVLLHRMKSILTDVPKEIFFDKGIGNDFILSIAKNALDITTWLFPYESRDLVSGFGNRLRIWGERRHSLVLSQFFEDRDYHFLEECLSIRKFPLSKYNEAHLLKQFVEIYEKSIAYCKKMNGLEANESLGRHPVSKELFYEYKIGRRIIEALKLIKAYRLFGASNLVRNIFLPRKGRQIEFCFEMIKSLSAHLEGDNEQSVDCLMNARMKLFDMRKIEFTENGDFVRQWQDLRNNYISLNNIFI